MTSVVEIDGSIGEGGGQVLRIALCLSALYRIPVKITNIRAGRPNPGLAAQHLKGVELLKKMCKAKVEGAKIGSTCLVFTPTEWDRSRHFTFVEDTRTAGSICLLAQVALPCAALFPTHEMVTLILRGGTNVPMAPQIEYLTEVLRPLLRKFGIYFDFTVISRGYYPKGGGEVHIFIQPLEHLKAVTIMDPGVPHKVKGWAYVSGVVPIKEADKLANDAKAVLEERLPKQTYVPRVVIKAYKEDPTVAFGNASGINLVGTTSTGCVFGSSCLGSARPEPIAPGVQAANALVDRMQSGSCIDEFAQDQLIVFMALATGTSKINLGNQKLTRHTETAIKIAETMLSHRNLRFTLHENKDDENKNSFYILECKGCGFLNELDKDFNPSANFWRF